MTKERKNKKTNEKELRGVLSWNKECKSSYRSIYSYSYIVDASAKEGYEVLADLARRNLPPTS